VVAAEIADADVDADVATAEPADADVATAEPADADVATAEPADADAATAAININKKSYPKLLESTKPE